MPWRLMLELGERNKLRRGGSMSLVPTHLKVKLITNLVSAQAESSFIFSFEPQVTNECYLTLILSWLRLRVKLVLGATSGHVEGCRSQLSASRRSFQAGCFCALSSSLDTYRIHVGVVSVCQHAAQRIGSTIGQRAAAVGA